MTVFFLVENVKARKRQNRFHRSFSHPPNETERKIKREQATMDQSSLDMGHHKSHFPTSFGVGERAVPSKQKVEWYRRINQRTSEGPSANVPMLGYSKPPGKHRHRCTPSLRTAVARRCCTPLLSAAVERRHCTSLLRATVAHRRYTPPFHTAVARRCCTPPLHVVIERRH